MQTRKRAHCARSVFPFIKKKKKHIGYSCRLRLSCELASCPGAYVVKSYTLVYFSSKASLLMIKNHNKYQSINLIGLAHVEKAYSKNRSIIVRIRESCDLW